MRSIRFRRLRALCMLLPMSFFMLLSACQLSELTCKSCGDDCPGHASVCEKPTIRALAHDLDSLEAHIEKYGSVVAQHPSVWGQARLTKHRQDFELQMAVELGNFTATLNGTLSRTDQAYLVNAFALSAAATSKNSSSGGSAASSSSSSAPSTNPLDASTADITGAFTSMTRNPATMPSLVGFKGLAGAGGVALEPTTYLRQKANYLNCLNELRRINEGDDTADSPGYALNLVRIPVSVLPGKCTERGFGAEVTMTLKPYLSDDLLPATFRNLVINDLLEVIGVPLTYFLNDPKGRDYAVYMKAKWDADQAIAQKKSGVEEKTPQTSQALPALPGKAGPATGKKRKQTGSQDIAKYFDSAQLESLPSMQLFMKGPAFQAARANNPGKAVPAQVVAGFKIAAGDKPVAPPALAPTKLRRAKRPFPPSQLPDIFGEDESTLVAVAAYEVFQDDPANKYWIHYPDIQGYLQEELNAAYRFLADPKQMPLWEHCSQALVTAIHTRDLKEIARIRDRFDDDAYAMTHRWSDEDVTVALAWAIIVESALLTDQLAQDMKEAAAAKNCADATARLAALLSPRAAAGGPRGVQRIRPLPLADHRLRPRSGCRSAEHRRHLSATP